MTAFADRVQETTTTTGTGTLTLGGAVAGYQSFATAWPAASTTQIPYCITDAAGNWETGFGTYTLSGNTLTRVVSESSNGNALVSFGAGTKNVFATLTAASVPGIGASTAKVTASGVSLGTQAASQSGFTYTTVPSICARGMMSQFLVTASQAGNFDLVVRGAGNDSGTLWLQAVAITPTTYLVSLPIYYENDAAAQDFFIGWRNNSVNSITLTLTSLRVEKFA